MKLAEAKRIHDALLSEKPEGVQHDMASCEFCVHSEPTTDVAANDTKSAAPESRKEGNAMEPIFTQEQADSLVEAAVSKVTAEAEAKLAEATASLTTELDEAKAEIAKLQEARDADQLSLASKEEEIASLKQDIANRDEEVAKAARKDERLGKVAEIAKFSDDYVAANTERWVEMSEDQFASYLDSIKDLASQMNVSAPKVEAEATKVPEETAMHTERVEAPVVSAKTALFSYSRGGAK